MKPLINPTLKPPPPPQTAGDSMDTFTGDTDICDQLLNRYNNSTAPQHRHLCATAAATRSIIQSESLPLSPLSYFAATIDALSHTAPHDVDAVSALSTFLSIVLPLVGEKAVAKDKAGEASEIVVKMMERECEGLPVSSVRALVKCLGVLVEFCELEDWDEVRFGFGMLFKYSVDKRPKMIKLQLQECMGSAVVAMGSMLLVHHWILYSASS